MGALSELRIAQLLAPYLACSLHGEADAQRLAPKLAIYLDLLLKWNARTNLTSIREPEEIVRRHFGESIFTAAQLRQLLLPGAGVLDFGSGAGFPGLPIQLYLSEVRCTLAESQGKKAAFLREAVRCLGVGAEVWAGRVEAMPWELTFDCVTMRAVDGMRDAVPPAGARVAKDGCLVILAGGDFALEDASLALSTKFAVPESDRRMLYLFRRRLNTTVGND